MPMDKRRAGVENSALSKPTWEIMKIMSEITDFCWEIISGAIFGVRISRKMWKTYFRFPNSPLFVYDTPCRHVATKKYEARDKTHAI